MGNIGQLTSCIPFQPLLVLQNNDSWNGILGLIDAGVVDTACIFLERTPRREPHFEFSNAVFKV